MTDSSSSDKKPVDMIDESELQQLVDFAKQIPHRRRVEDDATRTAPTLSRTSQPDAPSVSNYQVLECLGHGGMGAVWKAQQLEPVQREVALKVVHPHHTNGEFQERFSVERQALALMDHRGIAKLFDAGTTEAGQPFFAMELFLGKRIDHFCRHF